MYLVYEQDVPELVDSSGRPVVARERLLSGMTIKELDQFFKRTAKDADSIWQKSAWAYSAIDLVARSVAAIPFGVWTDAADSASGRSDRVRALTRPARLGSVRVTDSRVEDVLRRPNSRMAGEEMLAQLCVSLLSTGNAYLMLDRPPERGRPPRVMEPLLPAEVKPVRPSRQSRRLSAWQVNGEEVSVDLIVHFRLPSLTDPVLGDAPHKSMIDDVDAELRRAEFDAKFYANAAIPPTVLVHKRGPLNQVQESQIRQKIEEKYSGPAAAGKTMILGGDFDFKVIGVSQAQAQFRDVRQMFREMVAAIYHVPVGLISATEASGLSRAGLEVARRMLYDGAVIPLAFLIASKLTVALVGEVEPGRVFAFDLDQLPVMREDLDLKSQIYQRLVGSGIPPNAAVSLLDIDVDPVPGGDTPLVPSTLMPLAADGTVAAPQEKREDAGDKVPLLDVEALVARARAGQGVELLLPDTVREVLSRTGMPEAAAGDCAADLRRIAGRAAGCAGMDGVEEAVHAASAVAYHAGVRSWRSAWCSQGAHRGRYPGDALLSAEEVRGCCCVPVAALPNDRARW